jgi:hypothetical protein
MISFKRYGMINVRVSLTLVDVLHDLRSSRNCSMIFLYFSFSAEQSRDSIMANDSNSSCVSFRSHEIFLKLKFASAKARCTSVRFWLSGQHSNSIVLKTELRLKWALWINLTQHQCLLCECRSQNRCSDNGLSTHKSVITLFTFLLYFVFDLTWFVGRSQSDFCVPRICSITSTKESFSAAAVMAIKLNNIMKIIIIVNEHRWNKCAWFSIVNCHICTFWKCFIHESTMYFLPLCTSAYVFSNVLDITQYACV